MKLTIIPEGPLAFDGEEYLYSEGAGLYIDSISEYFEEITICAYAFHKGDFYYETSCNYHFKSPNLRFIELPHWKSNKTGILPKFIQMCKVAKTILVNIKNWDVIYLFLPGFPGAIAYLINRLFHKKYFVYLASEWSEEAELLFPWKGLIKKLLFPLYFRFTEWIERKTVGGSFLVLTAGCATYEKYNKSGIPIYETIPRLNWLDFDIFFREDTCQSMPIKLLYVGYLLPRKGLRYLIDAVSILDNRGSLHVTLTIVGSGPQKEELEDLVQKLGFSDKIKFLGHVSNGPELIMVYRDSDIFIFPTFSGEGFPRVLYEAMSQSIPIITTEVCGIPYKMKHEGNALLVPPLSSEVIADAIERMMMDSELRKRLIKNGQAFMQALLSNLDDNQVHALLMRHLPEYRNCIEAE